MSLSLVGVVGKLRNVNLRADIQVSGDLSPAITLGDVFQNEGEQE